MHDKEKNEAWERVEDYFNMLLQNPPGKTGRYNDECSEQRVLAPSFEPFNISQKTFFCIYGRTSKHLSINTQIPMTIFSSNFCSYSGSQHEFIHHVTSRHITSLNGIYSNSRIPDLPNINTRGTKQKPEHAAVLWHPSDASIFLV